MPAVAATSSNRGRAGALVADSTPAVVAGSAVADGAIRRGLDRATGNGPASGRSAGSAASNSGSSARACARQASASAPSPTDLQRSAKSAKRAGSARKPSPRTRTKRRRSASQSARSSPARSAWAEAPSSSPDRSRARASRWWASGEPGFASTARRKLSIAASGRPSASSSCPRKAHHREASAGDAGAGPRISGTSTGRPSCDRHSARPKRPIGSSARAPAAASRSGSAADASPRQRAARPEARRRKGSPGDRSRQCSTSLGHAPDIDLVLGRLQDQVDEDPGVLVGAVEGPEGVAGLARPEFGREQEDQAAERRLGLRVGRRGLPEGDLGPGGVAGVEGHLAERRPGLGEGGVRLHDAAERPRRLARTAGGAQQVGEHQAALAVELDGVDPAPEQGLDPGPVLRVGRRDDCPPALVIG